MSIQRKIIDWITINHRHIPIYEGESKAQAVTKAVVKANEDARQRQITQNKEQADKAKLAYAKNMVKGPKGAEIVATYDTRHRPISDFNIKSLGRLKDSDNLQDFISANSKNLKFKRFIDENGELSARQLWYEYRRQKEIKDIQDSSDYASIKEFLNDKMVKEREFKEKDIDSGEWDKWIWNSDSKAKPLMANDMFSNSGVFRYALMDMYWKYYLSDYRDVWRKKGRKIEDFYTASYSDKDAPMSFKKWINTPMKLYRGSRGQKFIDDDVFVSYTPLKDVALSAAKSDKGIAVHNKEGRNLLHTMTAKPIDTWAQMNFYTSLGEDEIMIPRGILEMSKKNKNR